MCEHKNRQERQVFPGGSLGSDLRSQEGASMIEYAILLSLMVFVALVAVASMGRNVSQQYSTISSVLETL